MSATNPFDTPKEESTETAPPVEATDDPPSWDGKQELTMYFPKEVLESPKAKKFLSGFNRERDTISQERDRLGRLRTVMFDDDTNAVLDKFMNTPTSTKEDTIKSLLDDEAALTDILKNEKAAAILEKMIDDLPAHKAKTQKMKEEFDKLKSELDLEHTSYVKFADEMLDGYVNHGIDEFTAALFNTLHTERPDLIEKINDDYTIKNEDVKNLIATALQTLFDTDKDYMSPTKLLTVNDKRVLPIASGMLLTLGTKYPKPASTQSSGTGVTRRGTLPVGSQTVTGTSGNGTGTKEFQSSTDFRNYLRGLANSR